MSPSSHRNDSWALRRAADVSQQAADRTVVKDYVQRPSFFENTVFIWTKNALEIGGPLHQNFLNKCKPLLANGRLTSLNDDEAEQYMNVLWIALQRDGSYIRWLSNKRSNKYQAIEDKFFSELLRMPCCSV